jgi:hypothetical protein
MTQNDTLSGLPQSKPKINLNGAAVAWFFASLMPDHAVEIRLRQIGTTPDQNGTWKRLLASRHETQEQF